MLIGVRGSWNTMPAAEIVTTSLKMPAMERVTTDVRCRRANSEAVMQNAITPGNNKINGPNIGPFLSINIPKPCHNAGNPSTGTAIKKSETNITGAR